MVNGRMTNERLYGLYDSRKLFKIDFSFHGERVERWFRVIIYVDIIDIALGM